MSHKIKKQKIIFLIVLVLCLAILAGGVIYIWKGSKPPVSPSEKSPPDNKEPTSTSVDRIKIKKTNDPNILSWKNEYEGDNYGGHSELTLEKEKIPEMFSNINFEKGAWIDDWEQKIKDNCWLVIEKRQELDQVVYSGWYENDQGEKLKEMESNKW